MLCVIFSELSMYIQTSLLSGNLGLGSHTVLMRDPFKAFCDFCALKYNDKPIYINGVYSGQKCLFIPPTHFFPPD